MRGLTALAALAALVITPFASARSDAPPARVDIVVGFKDGASGAKRAKALSEAAVKVDERLPKLDAVVVTARAADTAAVLRELRADRSVEYASREGHRKALLVPNDPGYTTVNWPYPQTTLPNAWDLGTGQASTVVAVLDSGVDAGHPDLPALAAGCDYVNDDANPADDNGHGTAVTGAFGARINNGVGAAGICPGCTVMPVKVLDDMGIGADADIALGIVWATDHGAKVINLSLGGPEYTQVLSDAVNYAIERGVVLIAAGGNDGTSDEMYPAALDGVIGVAGTASWPWGERIHEDSNFGQHLELAAPFCFYTTQLGGGYAESCGTSIASPIVAGVAGLMLSRTPALNRAQVESALTSTANGQLGLDVEYGLLDAYRSVLAAGSMPAVPVNTSLPQISGSLSEGATLTASNGSWTNNPDSYAYVWERCNAAGDSCGTVEGATKATYDISPADVGTKLRVYVKATNLAGTTSATSILTDVIGGDAPLPGGTDLYAAISASATAPALGSTVVYKIAVGHRPGSVAATKVSLAFTMPTGLSHVESKPSRGSCTVAGQTTTCDLGYLARTAAAELSVTAKVDMAGLQTVVASVTPTPEDAKLDDNMVTQTVTVPGPVTPAAPAGSNQALPPSVTVTGEAKVGATLTADAGSGWAGKAPHVYSYQWVACSKIKGKLRCTTLVGQTESALVVTRSHVGKRMHVVVVALASDGIGELRESALTDAVRS